MASSNDAPGSSSRKTSRILIFLALAAIASVYVRHYLAWPSPHAPTYVIQAAADRVRPELLAERQPLVVRDRVLDALPLARDALRFQHVYARARKGVHLSCLGRPLRTVAKATFVSPKAHDLPAPAGNDGEGGDDVFVLDARRVSAVRDSRDTREGGTAPISFRLRTSQILVLPAHWEVSCGSREHVAAYRLDVTEVFDALHLLMWLPTRCLGAALRGPTPSPPPPPSPPSPPSASAESVASVASVAR